MAIKTRFNIGQTIRFEWFGEICQEKIRGVVIMHDDLKVQNDIYYQTEKLKLVEEDKVIKGEL